MYKVRKESLALAQLKLKYTMLLVGPRKGGDKQHQLGGRLATDDRQCSPIAFCLFIHALLAQRKA